ncbi:MAG: hypothetical protein RLZZ200_3034 [Pseudomonadota bacterium]|jgi:hypothetical protein
MNAQAIQNEPEERGSRSFVVNLCASATPVALAPPDDPEFAGYHFFVTRRTEEGRERFRLHMGYFASIAEARDKVEDLRKRYPTAWAGPAPAGMASESASTKPADGLDALSNVRQVLATLDMDSSDSALLTPNQQWSLLQSGKLPDPHYAIQLLWSREPVDMASLPQPALFDVYSLYRVGGLRDGVRWHGLRLGFFTDVEAAKRVACYLKPDFESVVVVPVTESERDSASGEGEPRLLRRPQAEVPASKEPFETLLAEPELPAEARVEQQPTLASDPINPLAPEAVLLPLPSGLQLDGGLAAPEPFVLNSSAGAPPATTSPLPFTPRSALDVRTPDVAPLDTPLIGSQPDRRTLDLLGASALSVVEEQSDEPALTTEKKDGPDNRTEDLSASAIRHMKGLAKLFRRFGD